jgi:peptide/nickel transport system permease protein
VSTEAAPALAEGVDTPTPPGKSSALVFRALRLWRTRIGAVFILIVVALAVFGPLIAPHKADEFVAIPSSPPGKGTGLFGTDYLGQDVWSRFLDGGKDILIAAILATAIGLVVGCAIGLVAAYSRNALDDVLMRAMDVIMAFPQIMLARVWRACPAVPRSPSWSVTSSPRPSPWGCPECGFCSASCSRTSSVR